MKILGNKQRYMIKRHADKTYPRECCGFIVRNKNGEQIIYEAQNVSIKPNNFVLDPQSFLNAYKLGEIVAVYHSHPNGGEFSALDKKQCAIHEIPYVMFDQRKLKFYILLPERASEYIGRRFKIGVSDCYTLVKDYYYNELGIELDPIDIKSDWFGRNRNLIPQKAEEFSFQPFDKPQKNDVIVFDYGTGPKHLGIYLDNDFFLHLPRDGKSCIESTIRYKKFIKKYMRHPCLINK